MKKIIIKKGLKMVKENFLSLFCIGFFFAIAVFFFSIGFNFYKSGNINDLNCQSALIVTFDESVDSNEFDTLKKRFIKKTTNSIIKDEMSLSLYEYYGSDFTFKAEEDFIVGRQAQNSNEIIINYYYIVSKYSNILDSLEKNIEINSITYKIVGVFNPNEFIKVPYMHDALGFIKCNNEKYDFLSLELPIESVLDTINDYKNKGLVTENYSDYLKKLEITNTCYKTLCLVGIVFLLWGSTVSGFLINSILQKETSFIFLSKAVGHKNYQTAFILSASLIFLFALGAFFSFFVYIVIALIAKKIFPMEEIFSINVDAFSINFYALLIAFIIYVVMLFIVFIKFTFRIKNLSIEELNRGFEG